MTALDAQVAVRRGAFALDVTITAQPGEIVAVLGPNGAGKSTLLAVLAGHLAPSAGVVRVGERTLTAVGDGVTTAVRPERRSVGLLGQEPLVFPHLSARENVAFGPRAAGVPAAQARRTADEWLAAVGLGALADRRPDALSGGQRQRVALARALAAEPAVLLLDEPFAQLDVRTAAELRDLVRAQVRRTRTSTVLVTHDVLDAVTLADRVVVLHDGQVVERGRPLDVLTEPAHPFTAALAGVNLVVGRLVREPDGSTALAGPGGVRVPCSATDGTRAQVTFSPSAVTVGAGWPARVVDLEPGTTGVRVRTTGDVLVDLPPAQVARLGLQVGTELRLSVPTEHVRVRTLG
ncbi:ABC transporter ATP-binding protein [Cellulomonas fengjieae]|uniref:ABC transporter ATP-binding protein n=1 Tax=Cellulomonas fengjieae TaxID=2819978 RepID=A0ABS3SFP3_9CELL|nr:ABC transporter ATP-binding protein [Cellulomonas fengjieae]MBO3083781.1 ABC transporter ATP-binding protein [Cellulomonas fengjieae]QVI64928.1 ABC transporter ATP-binding protein [Cellulomonas fengjieae]